MRGQYDFNIFPANFQPHFIHAFKFKLYERWRVQSRYELCVLFSFSLVSSARNYLKAIKTKQNSGLERRTVCYSFLGDFSMTELLMQRFLS